MMVLSPGLAGLEEEEEPVMRTEEKNTNNG